MRKCLIIVEFEKIIMIRYFDVSVIILCCHWTIETHIHIMQAGMHFSGKYTTSYQYPPDHPIMLKLLMWLHHVTWQTVCGSIRLLFFFCTVNSYTTINYLPTMNSMRHPLITHDVLMKFSRAQCCKSYDNHTSSSWLLLWASHGPNSWEAHEPPTDPLKTPPPMAGQAKLS